MPVGRGAKEYLVARVLKEEHKRRYGVPLMSQSDYYYMPENLLAEIRQARIEEAEQSWQRSINGPEPLAIEGVRLLKKTKPKGRPPGPARKAKAAGATNKKGAKPTSKKQAKKASQSRRYD